MSSDSEEDDFGIIRPSLLRQLKAILDQYPDDGQILKVMLSLSESTRERAHFAHGLSQ